MLKEFFAMWRVKSDLTKLQYAYGVVIVVTLVAAGLIGLLNQAVAWQILSVTWIVAITLAVNVVSFALVNLVAPQTAVRRSTPRKR